MRFDLSFWDEPNWTRESTLSPFFIMTAIAATFLVAGIALAAGAARELSVSRAQLEALNQQNNGLKASAAKAAKMKAQIDRWDKVLKTFDGLATKNLLWSCQLEALQKSVPDDVTLETMTVSGSRKGDTTDNTGKLTLPAWQYSLVMTCLAVGENPQESINTFLDNLSHDPLLSTLMTPELRETVTRADGSKKFKLICTYQLR